MEERACGSESLLEGKHQRDDREANLPESNKQKPNCNDLDEILVCNRPKLSNKKQGLEF
jgi:hypothetical protein